MADEKDLAAPEAAPEAAATAAATSGASAQEAADQENAEPANDDRVDGDSDTSDDHVAELESEIAELKDQLLRAVAETENVRRRTQREREDALKYGAVPLLRDILGVADNLERALGSVEPNAADESESLKNLLTGVQLIERELHATLERHKVERLEPTGQPFDPHLHEAMFEMPDPTAVEGTVVQVLQPGYRLHDRLLRPARVGVAKGGPSAGAGAPGSTEPGSRVDTEA